MYNVVVAKIAKLALHCIHKFSGDALLCCHYGFVYGVFSRKTSRWLALAKAKAEQTKCKTRQANRIRDKPAKDYNHFELDLGH